MELIKKEDDIEKITKSNSIVIFQFGSESCSPCASLKNKLINEFGEDKRVSHFYIDVESNKKISASFDVFSVPTIVVFVDSKLCIRESGYFSLEKIISRIYRYLELM